MNIFSLFFSRSSQMPGLLGGKNRYRKGPLFTQEYTRATDRQTDRQTVVRSQ